MVALRLHLNNYVISLHNREIANLHLLGRRTRAVTGEVTLVEAYAHNVNNGSKNPVG